MGELAGYRSQRCMSVCAHVIVREYLCMNLAREKFFFHFKGPP